MNCAFNNDISKLCAYVLAGDPWLGDEKTLLSDGSWLAAAAKQIANFKALASDGVDLASEHLVSNRY